MNNINATERSTRMLLEDKVAVIYGGSGSIGSVVAREFAEEGAKVYIVGRTESALNGVAEDIRSHEGEVDIAVVDATNEQSVDEFVDATVAEVDHIDISFNVIGYGDVQEPLNEISMEDFLQPITTATRTQF